PGDKGLNVRILIDRRERRSRSSREGHALRQQHPHVLSAQRLLRTEGIAAAVRQRVADVELSVLFALVRLNGEVERVVPLRPIGLQLQRGWQRTSLRSLPLGQLNCGLFRQDNFKTLRAPLRARGVAGVVNEVTFQNMELAVRGFKLHYVG